MKVTRDKETANFVLIFKPENKEDNELLLEMVDKGYAVSFSELNGEIKELTLYAHLLKNKTNILNPRS